MIFNSGFWKDKYMVKFKNIELEDALWFIRENILLTSNQWGDHLGVVVSYPDVMKPRVKPIYIYLLLSYIKACRMNNY